MRIVVGWRKVMMIVLFSWMVQFERCLKSEVGSMYESESSFREIHDRIESGSE